MEITSRDNPLVKDVRRLLGDAKYRKESGLFVTEGARLCADAVFSKLVVETAFITDRARRQYAAYVKAVTGAAHQSVTVPDALFAYMSDTDSPQGVLCICRKPPLPTAPKADGCYIALERIQDPGNLGTVIRTAEALGIRGVLLSDGCCDPYSPKVLRSSMGGVFRLSVYAAGDLAETLPVLHKQGFRSFACVVDPAANAVNQTAFGCGSLCVIGNEGNGLSPETIAACSERITIPMSGRAESLNASMAAGIVLWEMVRG